MDNWQPIETAPKDGLIILTCWGELMSMAGFDAEKKKWFVCIPPRTYADLYWQQMTNVEWSPEYWFAVPKTPEAT